MICTHCNNHDALNGLPVCEGCAKTILNERLMEGEVIYTRPGASERDTKKLRMHFIENNGTVH